MAKQGIGAIVLLGANPPGDLKARLQRAVDLAPDKALPPLFGSDEEGGTLQRLAPLLGALPSARTMATWPASKIEATARDYATKMRELGVPIVLAPVADLAVPGSFISVNGRSFGPDPDKVAEAVIAWSKGVESAGAIPVLKHWPGHGHAVDSHKAAASVPDYESLKKADLIPFEKAMKAGVPVVMLGHLTSAGLTEPGVPASQSPKAIAELRAAVGPDVVIVTDSLIMAAASSARGLSPEKAAVTALAAGADWAMSCVEDMTGTLDAVTKAIDSGKLDRANLERSAERILALRERL
jgi:beta-N-acetylhexosaminidase